MNIHAEGSELQCYLNKHWLYFVAEYTLTFMWTISVVHAADPTGEEVSVSDSGGGVTPLSNFTFKFTQPSF